MLIQENIFLLSSDNEILQKINSESEYKFSLAEKSKFKGYGRAKLIILISAESDKLAEELNLKLEDVCVINVVIGKNNKNKFNTIICVNNSKEILDSIHLILDSLHSSCIGVSIKDLSVLLNRRGYLELLNVSTLKRYVDLREPIVIGFYKKSFNLVDIAKEMSVISKCWPGSKFIISAFQNSKKDKIVILVKR